MNIKNIIYLVLIALIIAMGVMLYTRPNIEVQVIQDQTLLIRLDSIKNALELTQILAEDAKFAADSLEQFKPKIIYKYINGKNEIIDFDNSAAHVKLLDEIAGFNPR